MFTTQPTPWRTHLSADEEVHGQVHGRHVIPLEVEGGLGDTLQPPPHRPPEGTSQGSAQPPGSAPALEAAVGCKVTPGPLVESE